MVSAFPLHRYTYEDYVGLEAESSTRHEYLEASLAAIVIVSHREQMVEVSTRSGSGWNKAEFRAGDRATIVAIGVELDVAALYAAAEEPR